MKKPIGVLVFGISEILISVAGLVMVVFLAIAGFQSYFFRVAALLGIISLGIVMAWLFWLGLSTLRLKPLAWLEHLLFSPLLAFLMINTTQMSLYLVVGKVFHHEGLYQLLFSPAFRLVWLGLSFLSMLVILFYFTRPGLKNSFGQVTILPQHRVARVALCVICVFSAVLVPLGMIGLFTMIFLMGVGNYIRIAWWHSALYLILWIIYIPALRLRVASVLSGSVKKLVIVVASFLILAPAFSALDYLGYQNYLKIIYKEFIGDTLPQGVKLIEGAMVSWLDFYASLTLSLDNEAALNEIAAGFTEISQEQASSQLGLAAPASGEGRYFYKETRKSQNAVEICYLVWDKTQATATLSASILPYQEQMPSVDQPVEEAPATPPAVEQDQIINQ